MDITRLWFSFEGRINRAKYWLVSLISQLIAVALVLIVITANSWAAGLIVIPFLISTLAAAVKRLHDREKSAWWLLLFYLLPLVFNGLAEVTRNGGSFFPITSFLFTIASLAISLWAFVELGCMRGTVGPNRYGPDPLEGRG